MIDKLKNLPKIHYISLEENIERRTNLENWFKKYNITNYVSYLFKRFDECNYNLIGPYVDSLAPHSKGPITSHFILLKEWYETTNEPYTLIVEDDLSLETISYWNFTWEEFFNALPKDWNCIQLVLIREHLCDNYFFKKRKEQDWCAGAYLIKREYVKLLLDLYYFDNYFNLDIKDLTSPPVIEHLLFTNKPGVYCFPLFVEDCYNTHSSLLPENAHAELINGQGPMHHFSYDCVINWWKTKGMSLNIDQIFKKMTINKLEGFPTIYCASLEESIDRRKKLNIQFAEYGLKPKYLLSKRYHECNDVIAGASLFSVDDKIKGCAVSHLKMIKEWYDTTNEEYGFFCEDDLSLETVKYWNFTFQEFINQLPTDWEAVQMCIIRDTFDEIKLRKRQLDDWAVTAYIIKREYAKKIIDYYIIQSKNTTESTPFQQESITYKLEVNGWPQVQPLVEHIILLNTGIVYCFPLFIENINNPTTSSESQAPNHITSANFIKNWWENQYTISSNNVIPKEISLNIDQNFEQFPKKLMEHFYHSIGENWFDYQDLYSQMVNYFPDKAHFIEVGSWKGRSAAYMAVEIINSQKHIKFDCIDTWEGSEEHITPESSAFNPELLEDKNWLYKLFLTNIAPVNHTINPIRTTSLEASKLYPNRSLDFVFIDASHDYENVKADIEAWYPKVKIGGYIGGHDYPFWDGVKKAVDEFLQQDFIKKENITINNISTWLYKK